MDPAEQSQSVKRVTERQYHSKRPHRKSRTGCRNCKTRKVKCDEARPACRSCTLRKEDCVYPKSPSSSPTYSRVVARRKSPDVAGGGDSSAHLLKEPLFVAGGRDVVDMKLLWFYTTQTFDSFVSPESAPVVSDILRIKVVQHAFQTPFLMHTLLGLTAQHLRHLHQDISPARAIAYRISAFEGYRAAINDARPENYPALLACSLLLCGMAADHFRDPDAKPLYIVDFMQIWRGVNLIIHLLKAEAVYRAGMMELFHRPPLDLDAAAAHIPSHLLFMVSSIKDGDKDFKYKDVYYHTLKDLGTLYMELENGFSPTMAVRVVVFFTYLHPDFFILAQQRRPRALVIIAYYLAFARAAAAVWWMDRVSDREIWNIYNYLGEEWQSLLQIPMLAAQMADKLEIARLLLNNNAWDPTERRHPGATVALIDNFGNALDYRFTIPLRQQQETDDRLRGYVTELEEEGKRYSREGSSYSATGDSDSP